MAERSISLTSRGDRQKESGDVYDLVDVLQFYASPDGNGRFAEIDRNGWLILNDDINYFTPFATQILQQVIYANLNIFTAPYEDENGVHPYGVFDVNNGYDVEGKTLEEIIENSTINLDRMNNFSFVDENGISLFEEGAELNLPQFNYRINFCEKRTETPQATTTPEPTQSCDPTPTVPPETEEPPIITPGPTQSCDPTPTVPLETEEPPTITPGPTTPAPEATEVPSATDVPVEEPEFPENTSCPTTPPSEEVVEEETPVIIQTPTQAPVETTCPTSTPVVIEEEETPPTIVEQKETKEQECNDLPMAEDIEVEEPPTL